MHFAISETTYNLEREESHTHTNAPWQKEQLLWLALHSKQGFAALPDAFLKASPFKVLDLMKGPRSHCPGESPGKGGSRSRHRRATKHTQTSPWVFWRKAMAPSSKPPPPARHVSSERSIRSLREEKGRSGAGVDRRSRFLVPHLWWLRQRGSPPLSMLFAPAPLAASTGGGQGRVHLSKDMSSAKLSWPRRKQRRQRH